MCIDYSIVQAIRSTHQRTLRMTDEYFDSNGQSYYIQQNLSKNPIKKLNLRMPGLNGVFKDGRQGGCVGGEGKLRHDPLAPS